MKHTNVKKLNLGFKLQAKSCCRRQEYRMNMLPIYEKRRYSVLFPYLPHSLVTFTN